jgi:hypothetical protein
MVWDPPSRPISKKKPIKNTNNVNKVDEIAQK